MRAPKAQDTAEALVSQWCAAALPGPGLRARLAARCAEAAPHVRAGLARAPDDPALQALWAHLSVSWHRQHLPAGMVYIPQGALELPRHQGPRWGPSGERVQVAAFYIDRTEVTVGAWRQWVDARLAAGDDSALALPDDPASAPDLPVSDVTWTLADRYAREARGGRLPRLEEFERAVRGSGLSTWPWGEADPAGRANLEGTGPGQRRPVASLPDGASGFGVLDLVGNVAEWSDSSFAWGRVGRHHHILGASFRDPPEPARMWRAPDRLRAPLGDEEGRPWLGFRVVVVPPDLAGE